MGPLSRRFGVGCTNFRTEQGRVPVGGAVVAVVGQEVIVELPEDVQRDPAVRSGDVVVGLAEHGVHAVQCEKLTQQLVGQSTDLQQTVQLLTWRERKHGPLLWLW